MELLFEVGNCLLSLLLFGLYMYMVFWVIDDANSFGKNGLLVGILVFFTGILGLVGWLLYRTSLADAASGSGFQEYRRPCPHCAEMIKEEARICHFCGRAVEPLQQTPPPAQKTVCADCGTICDAFATFCPSCLGSVKPA